MSNFAREGKMNYEKTELYFLQKDVLRHFGDAEGEKIFNRASKLYAELVVTTDYKNSVTLERQLKRLVYPVIAFYKTLLAFGYKIPNALGIVIFSIKGTNKLQNIIANDTPSAVFPNVLKIAVSTPKHIPNKILPFFVIGDVE